MESQKSFSETEIIQALKSLEGVKVIEQRHYELPQVIDYSGLKPEDKNREPYVAGLADSTARQCKRFLSGIIITDSFEDHALRRKWHSEMARKYGAEFVTVFQKNNLRINRLFPVPLALRTLSQAVDMFKIRSDKAAALTRLAAECPDLGRYDDNSLEGKLEIVRQVEAICLSFLELMSKPDSSEKGSVT